MAKNPMRPRLVKFNTERLFSKNQAAVRKAMQQVAREMQAKIKDKISVQGPPRSTPFNPPHQDTGFLHDNLTVTASGRQISVRVPQYGIWLEGGTRVMDPRPFIRDTVGGKNGKAWIERVAVLVKKYNALQKSGL